MLNPTKQTKDLHLVSILIGKTAAHTLLGKYGTWQHLEEASHDELLRLVSKDTAIAVHSPCLLNSIGLRDGGLVFRGKIDDGALRKIITEYKTMPDLEAASSEELVGLIGRTNTTVVRAMIVLAEKSRIGFPPVASPADIVEKARAQHCGSYPNEAYVAPLDRHLRCPLIRKIDDVNLDRLLLDLPGYTSAVTLITFHRHDDTVPTAVEEFYFNEFFTKARAMNLPVMDYIVIDRNWQFFSYRLQPMPDKDLRNSPQYPNEPDPFRFTEISEDLRIFVEGIVGKRPS